MGSQDQERPLTRISRWGLPELRGNGRLVGAAIVDSTGSGLLFAFQVIYFATTTSLSLTQVGAALTLAQLLTLPAPTLWGPVVDRFGPGAVAATGNCLAAAGFAGFLVADSFWPIVTTVLIVQFGVAAYWTSHGALVAVAAREDERTRWFALMHALRNGGVGLGGALAAGALAWGGGEALRWLVIGNAASYLLAAALLATWRPPRHGIEAAQTAAGNPTRPAGYATVLRDRMFMRLVAVNVCFVLATMVLNVLLALYILEVLEGSSWMAAVLLTVNTVLVTTTQTRASRWVERRRATRVMAAAAALNVVAFIGFVLLDGVPHSLILPGLLAAVAVYTAAEVLQSPAMGALSVSLAPAELLGRYQGVFQMSWVTGGAIAPLLFTTLLDHGAAWPWLLLVTLSLLSILALMRLDGDLDTRQATQKSLTLRNLERRRA
jgi:MFS family permease